MNPKYTVIIRKSKLGYVAVCLELNVSAYGETIISVEKELTDAITLYLEDIKDNPQTVVEPISIKDLTEFLTDTKPESQILNEGNFRLKPFEIYEAVSYA